MSSETSKRNLDQFINRLREIHEEPQPPTWVEAHAYGAPAIGPIAALLSDSNMEIRRNAKRGLYQIVRHSSRPGSGSEKSAVQEELVRVLSNAPSTVRPDALWMLSEIADDRAVPAIAAWLSDETSREAARCALMRIPGKKATAALKSALASSPEPFRYALAEALRKRGETVKNYPSRKLLPNGQTTVTPLQPRTQ